MGWQSDLREAAEAERERRGRMEPWWVIADPPFFEHVWCTTREAGEGHDLTVVARVLYACGVTFSVTRSTDPGMARVDLDVPREHVAVDESDMAAFMGAVRRTGIHGRYRKAGTDREYRF